MLLRHEAGAIATITYGGTARISGGKGAGSSAVSEVLAEEVSPQVTILY